MADDICEISRIVRRQENEAQLQKTQMDAIKRLHKLELVLKILKSVDANQLDVNDKQRFQNLIKLLAIQDYIYMSDTDRLLGLDNVENISLSYTERKALREHLFTLIRKICTPIIETVDRIQNEIPHIFESETQRRQLIDLEERRRNLHQELLHAKSRKCELLKKCTDLKLASLEKNELKKLATDYKLNQVKVDTLRVYLFNEFCSRTQHTAKAVNEIEGYIDVELEALED